MRKEIAKTYLVSLSLQLAKLSPEDMKAVKNMRLLEEPGTKKASHGSFSLKFDAKVYIVSDC